MNYGNLTPGYTLKLLPAPPRNVKLTKHCFSEFLNKRIKAIITEQQNTNPRRTLDVEKPWNIVVVLHNVKWDLKPLLGWLVVVQVGVVHKIRVISERGRDWFYSSDNMKRRLKRNVLIWNRNIGRRYVILLTWSCTNVQLFAVIREKFNMGSRRIETHANRLKNICRLSNKVISY